jgi:hypothetical protein
MVYLWAPCRYLAFHARGGNHCHVNFIGIPKDMAPKARGVFEQEAAKHGFTFEWLTPSEGVDSQTALHSLVGAGQYFMAHLPDGARLVHPIQRCDPVKS